MLPRALIQVSSNGIAQNLFCDQDHLKPRKIRTLVHFTGGNSQELKEFKYICEILIDHF